MLSAAALLAGCGAGFGPGDREGTAEVAATRDYGSEVLFDRTVDDLSRSSTAMRVLDGLAEIETRYGGGFVQSIDGISGAAGARSSDWFYFVNGIAADRGAAEFVVEPGDEVWWDYRDWTGAMDVRAVVGAYPAPLTTGYGGESWPVSVECPVEGPACDLTRDRLSSDGVEVDGPATDTEAIRVLVGDWPTIRTDPAAARLGAPPAVSGVFARFSEDGPRSVLEALTVTGGEAGRYGPGAGLVAAVRIGDGPPVWLVTGTDAAGVEAAASALREDALRHRYSVAVHDDRVFGVPVTGVERSAER